MGVAVNERKIAVRMIAREETGRRIEKSFVEIAPFKWQAVTEAVGKRIEVISKS